MTIREVLFVLVSLACAGHGRRVQIPAARLSDRSTLTSHESLAKLLLAPHPASAFNPYSPRLHSHMAASRVQALARRDRLHHQVPLWRADTHSRASATMFAPPYFSLLESVTSQDVCIAVGTAVASLGWSFIVGKLANASVVTPVLGRKLLHMTCAPGFLLTWPLFTNSPAARWIAAAVPLLSVLRLLRASFGVPSVSGLVRAVSRSGKSSEVLGGPLYYTLVLLVATVFGWRSPIAAVAVCQMAIGDGIADVYGRKFGKTKWPFNSSKSVEGSVAFVVGGFLASLGMVSLLHATGYTELTALGVAPALLLISFLCSGIELLSGVCLVPFGSSTKGTCVLEMDDNISVPGFAALFAYLLLR